MSKQVRKSATLISSIAAEKSFLKITSFSFSHSTLCLAFTDQRSYGAHLSRSCSQKRLTKKKKQLSRLALVELVRTPIVQFSTLPIFSFSKTKVFVTWQRHRTDKPIEQPAAHAASSKKERTQVSQPASLDFFSSSLVLLGTY